MTKEELIQRKQKRIEELRIRMKVAQTLVDPPLKAVNDPSNQVDNYWLDCTYLIVGAAPSYVVNAQMRNYLKLITDEIGVLTSEILDLQEEVVA